MLIAFQYVPHLGGVLHNAPPRIMILYELLVSAVVLPIQICYHQISCTSLLH